MKLSDFEDRKEILGTGNRFWGLERISHFAYLCCPYLLQKSKEIWKEYLCPSGGSNPGLSGEKPRRYHWAILHCWKWEEILVNIYYTCCPGMIDTISGQGRWARGGGQRAGGQCPALLLACPDSVPVPNYCFWDRFFGTDFFRDWFFWDQIFWNWFIWTDCFGTDFLWTIFWRTNLLGDQ